jgi:hypothetical protein
MLEGMCWIFKMRFRNQSSIALRCKFSRSELNKRNRRTSYCIMSLSGKELPVCDKNLRSSASVIGAIRLCCSGLSFFLTVVHRSGCNQGGVPGSVEMVGIVLGRVAVAEEPQVLLTACPVRS